MIDEKGELAKISGQNDTLVRNNASKSRNGSKFIEISQITHHFFLRSIRQPSNIAATLCAYNRNRKTRIFQQLVNAKLTRLIAVTCKAQNERKIVR